MKKLYILLTAILPVFISGCGGGGSTAADKIVGTWDCESLILDGDETKLESVDLSLNVTFNGDMTWSAVTNVADILPSTNGTYTVSNEKLVLKHSSGEYSWDIQSLTDTRAQFLWPDHKYYTNFDNDEFILVFVKR